MKVEVGEWTCFNLGLVMSLYHIGKGDCPFFFLHKNLASSMLTASNTTTTINYT